MVLEHALCALKFYQLCTEGDEKFGWGGETDDTERADKFGRRVWGIGIEGRLVSEGSVIVPLWFLLRAVGGRMEMSLSSASSTELSRVMRGSSLISCIFVKMVC